MNAQRHATHAASQSTQSSLDLVEAQALPGSYRPHARTTHWTGPRRRRHVTASKQPKPWTKATRPCQSLGRTRTGGPLFARPCFVVLAVALARPPPTTPPISCFHRFVASPCMHAWDRVVSRSSSVYWFAHHIIPWSIWSLVNRQKVRRRT